MKLSVIVPVYNAETYLCKCLDSLTGIPCLDAEIICIDDGSTDASWEICKRYAAEDCRVKIFRQDNAGPMAARNRGLREAAGEYICFVDSDDWIDPEMPMRFICKMDEDPAIDVCISDAVRNYPDGSEQNIFREATERMYTGDEAWKEMLLNRVFFWYMWGKVYRRSAVSGVYVDESVLTSEDLEFNWELFKRGRVRNVWYSPEHRYHYFANPESLTEGAEILKRKQSDLKVYKKILAGGPKREFSDIMKLYALRAIYDILRELCFHNAGDTELGKYVAEGKKLAFALDGCNAEVIRYVNRMCALTENVERARRYFADIYKAVREVIVLSVPVEKEVAVYVYGTGIAAGYTAGIMEGILDYEGHVVSDGQPCMGWFRGKPVCRLSQVPEDSLLILAMNQSNQEVVLHNLTGRRRVIRLPVPDGF